MRNNHNILRSFYLIAVLCLTRSQADACTVFTMTDGERVLFCDNEDFSNPRTRIWFVPATSPKHGCVYLGFDDGWGQNGRNDKGLAYGWVAGFKERWERQPEMCVIDGKPCHQMLESCATVEEAIAFFECHWEESFSYGQMLVADRTGKSVVIRAKDGQLHAPIVKKSQGIGHRFGLRGTEAIAMLANVSTPSLPDAARLLKATTQEGVNATKYSVVFDLNSPDIFLHRFPAQSEPIHFNLYQELDKGPHYYDIPELPKQLTEEPQPLMDEMMKH